MGSKEKSRSGKQLFFYLKNLSSAVDHEDDFGTLVGYSLFNSLINPSLDPSAEPIIETMDDFYASLSRSRNTVIKEGYNTALENIKGDVDSSLFSSLNEHGSASPLDSLYNRIVFTYASSERNHEQKLRTDALHLDSLVNEKGAIWGTKNRIADSNYNDVVRSFVF
ncbi:MAG: hypothetical protein ACI9P9_000737 [Patescibacteria group bacterium]|jgi:hypothetical protein